MSFAIWNEKPPFAFSKDDREQVYQVGDKWIVTDDPARATQAEIDAVLNAAPAPKKLTDGDLAVALVKANVLTQAQVDAATAQANAEVVK